MKAKDAAVSGLLEFALALFPGAAFSQRFYFSGLVLGCVYFFASMRLELFQTYHNQYPGASRFGLTNFVAWAIGGLLASISLPMKLIVVPILLIGTFIYSAISRPRIDSP